MRRKNRKKMLAIVVGTLVVVLVAVYGVFSWNMSHKLKNAQQENEKLQEKVASLEDQNAELQGSLTQLQEESKKNADETTGDTADDTAQGAADQIAVEGLDMEHIPAGTLIEETRIDREQLPSYFCSYSISDEIYGRIEGKSYRENDDISLENLRYLKVLHYNFDHQIQMGELIVNADVAESMVQIFRELFEAEYEIQSMHLIDDYWAGDGDSSDTASIEVNNTSAFCYREITGGTSLSNHAYGKAIDINPQQNPYVSYKSGSPVWHHDNADEYIARDTGLAHVITHEDICFQIFLKYGFSWGGDWDIIKDYQHFEYVG
ncbi:MAG: M15 family peptidase [Clostridia bacterium]|nr:M15 family peptidase [Clostridia bacterium]NCC42080.1 M15 family peptidase [Clostridia bacterium]